MAEPALACDPENLQRRYTTYRHDRLLPVRPPCFDVNVVFAVRVARHYSIVLAGAARWEVRVEERGRLSSGVKRFRADLRASGRADARAG